jgi:hypothetical protein
MDFSEYTWNLTGIPDLENKLKINKVDKFREILENLSRSLCEQKISEDCVDQIVDIMGELEEKISEEGVKSPMIMNLRHEFS